MTSRSLALVVIDHPWRGVLLCFSVGIIRLWFDEGRQCDMRSVSLSSWHTKTLGYRGWWLAAIIRGQSLAWRWCFPPFLEAGDHRTLGFETGGNPGIEAGGHHTWAIARLGGFLLSWRLVAIALGRSLT